MKTLVLLVFTLLLASPAFAQNPADKLSPAERREAQKLAHTFARRLLRTRDITPLVNKYFVPDFLDGYLQETEQPWFIFLERNVTTQVSRAELRRYFIAELNWFYMGDLYVFSKHWSADLEMPPEKMYPRDVLEVFRSDPRLRATVDNTEVDDSDLMIRTVEEFRIFTQRLEHATRLLRKHARRINAGHTPQYRDALSDWTRRFDLYEPSLTQSKGTRRIDISVPSIQLQLARVNGRMRIVSAWFLIE